MTTILIVGTAAFYMTLLLRALMPAKVLARKPVSCDLCMSFWCSAPCLFPFGVSLPEIPAYLLASAGVSLLLLTAKKKMASTNPVENVDVEEDFQSLERQEVLDRR